MTISQGDNAAAGPERTRERDACTPLYIPLASSFETPREGDDGDEFKEAIRTRRYRKFPQSRVDAGDRNEMRG